MKYFILLLLVFGAAGNHAKTIEEVIVKADLRQASTMHLASSLTVISEDVIQARAAQHFEDIIQAIPNFILKTFNLDMSSSQSM